MLMNTGMIITITINKNSGDFDRMFIDRSLINILSSEQISDGITFILFYYGLFFGK